MNFLKKLTKKHLIIIAVILTTACLAVPLFVNAWSGLDTVLISISSWIAQEIIYVVGQLLLIAISILIKVAGFNEFVDAEIVKTGWVIVRDVANLAIVISLLIIAFYTVINKQSFHYKTMLPKLILAAILVNFSKSITGLLIDFGQIVMMYFVHAFEGIAAGNLTYGFGIEDMMSVRNVAEAQGAEVNDWNVFGALILAVIMVVVALGVVVSMAVMLLARIITLWILIIFSPLAFVGSLVPGLDAITGDWWDRLKKNIIFGPTLAFLFWLSMTVISSVTSSSRMMNLQMSQQEYLAGGQQNMSATDYTYFASQVSSPQRVFDYMVTVGLLIMTLTVAQKAGVVGASVAGKWEAKMKGAGKTIGKWTAKAPFRATGAGANALLRRLPKTGITAPISRLAQDRYVTRQKKKQQAWSRRLEKIGVGEETADWLENTLPNRFPTRNLNQAARRIGGDARSARILGGNLNDPTLGQNEWRTIGSVYSSGSGVSGTFKRTLPNLDVNAIASLRAALADRDPAGNATLSDNTLMSLQRAMASYLDGGGDRTAGQIPAIIAALNAEATTGIGRGNLQEVADYEGHVVYSKTNTNDLIKHNQMKQSFEEFKLNPENANKNEDQLKQEFFNSQKARQSLKAGNQDVSNLVSEANQAGISASSLQDLGVQNLNVVAGQMQFKEPVEMASPEQMQSEFERMEKEMGRIAGTTHQGVTTGQYGRQEGNNKMAVGFDELNQYMKDKNLGHISGLEDETSEGVRVQNVDKVRQGLAGMLQEQLSNLSTAKTGEEKAKALESFGIQTDIENPKLENLIKRAKAKGQDSLTKLKNKELVDDEGLILVNKNREAGAVREIIRHEDAHDLIQGNDPTGETRQEVADSLNDKTKQRIDQHLKGRSDYSQLNDAQKMEEYSADVLAGRVKDDDFKQTLSNSGLLSKTASSKGQVATAGAVVPPVVVDLKDFKIEPQIKEAIKKSPEMQQTITKINQNTSQPGFFSNDLQFRMFRKDFRQVAEQIGRLSKTLNFNFGKLGKQIVNLDKVLPNEDASSIEIKAATQEAGINEKDLKDFLQDINT